MGKKQDQAVKPDENENENANPSNDGDLDQEREDRADDVGADGAGATFGPHNVAPGHHVSFHAGAFKGRGKVTGCGGDGCLVADDTGREHRVHWHEVMGRHGDDSRAAKQQQQPMQKSVLFFTGDPAGFSLLKANPR